MKKIPGHTSELGDFIGNAESQQITGAILGDAESRQKLERSAIRQCPSNCGRNVVRCAIHAKVLVSAKAAIHLHSDLNILRTEIAAVGPRFECEWTADANGVAELERRMFNILLGDEVLGNRPSLEVAPKNELRFKLSLFLEPGPSVWHCQIIAAVVVDDFQQAAISPVDVLELEIQHGIDPMLSGQKPEAVLPPIARKQSALSTCGLPIKVQLARPPAPHAVFKFSGSSEKPITTIRLADGILCAKLQIAGFLHLMRVRDEERSFTGPTCWHETKRCDDDQPSGGFRSPRG